MAMAATGGCVALSTPPFAGTSAAFTLLRRRPFTSLVSCRTAAPLIIFVAASSSSPQVATSQEGIQQQQEQQQESNSAVKEFLGELAAVGRIRIIVNTGVAVLESVTSNLDKLFYSDLQGKGEYANLMSKDDNVDFHLLLDKVAAAKLVEGKSMAAGKVPTYLVRLMDAAEANVATFLVMWRPGSPGDYDDGQVQAFQSLKNKYGDHVSFK